MKSPARDWRRLEKRRYCAALQSGLPAAWHGRETPRSAERQFRF